MTTTDLDRITLPTEAANADAPTLAELIDHAISNADRQRAMLAQAGDLDALAHGLHALRRVANDLRVLIGLVDADVSRLNLARPKEDGPAVIDGLGVLETKRRSAKQTWDSDRLLGVLVDRICDTAVVDPHTGERRGDPATAARIADLLREYLAAAIPLTPSMGWRIGGLTKCGIDPDLYRERTLGDHSTRIISPEGVSR